MSEILAAIGRALLHYPDSIAACGLFGWLLAMLVAVEEARRRA